VETVKLKCYSGENTISENNYDDLIIDNYDYGSILGLSYEITDKIIVGGNFYYGINNILENEMNDWKWQNQQITIGLKYLFMQIKKNKKE